MWGSVRIFVCLFDFFLSYLVGNTCVASVNNESKVAHGVPGGDKVGPPGPTQELPEPPLLEPDTL